MNEITPPLNVTQLNERLARVAAEMGIPVARARVMLCTLVISPELSEPANSMTLASSALSTLCTPTG